MTESGPSIIELIVVLIPVVDDEPCGLSRLRSCVLGLLQAVYHRVVDWFQSISWLLGEHMPVALVHLDDVHHVVGILVDL